MEQLPILSRQEFDDLLNQAGQLVIDWFNLEISRLSRRKILFRKIRKNTYQIGSLTMSKNNEEHWEVIHNDKKVNDFYYRSSAFFYCLCWLDNDLITARELLELDRTLNSRLIDHFIFKENIKKVSSDSLRREILISRFTENVQQINTIKARLQKTIIDAKYKKTRNSYESYRN